MRSLLLALRVSRSAQLQLLGSIRGMKVYTKTGDKGTSQLFSGERRPKNDAVFQALGDTDELNAHIGVAVEQARVVANVYLPPKLEQIQSRLFDLGACVATPLTSASETKQRRTGVFDEANVTQLEHWIDEMDTELPPIKCFILPSGGGLTSTHLHVARAVCRRAERSVVPLVAAGDVDGVVQRYLNRLSDFLFVSARYAAVKEDKEETKWVNQNIKPEKKDDNE
ncbi:ATP:cob(I)alamin adenosyltransferase [Phytophthora nicotianae CJ01A1]|uniref:Corrinoid adenosyltransferase MMAB n=6 Tax=Phytophthora nicotianae TaxID=4792 RepID=W2PFA3_PHYN3|nr:ATP:cob(I)alamin adenosyltransferase [Phytophthora nicotianae INRA-310]ETI54470.1 ATP:cob(I)alamin adenosyltransferase [Phytophthora nicotianae P1569]ETK94340.1 ATP:cob(I)alamin adenosyltransferase [Phytophthora nicotianae]ETO83220.1 ATP:cob(I)alamin adenosyltransferase [Phytophthora nicotianae P1976]ETP24307.1 ATP:cob(I)alamin adenosyltransferase [Phytophthora nicotianae CJ01A1]ETP52283.1 ATP:cob(I)alamin adenosyltransferase [Phytophthora nicotianae P10297]KUF76573.1 Cob(I)yrinic acid a [